MKIVLIFIWGGDARYYDSNLEGVNVQKNA